MSTITAVNQAQGALERNIQQLSSGTRINSAADDAAGQAIATRMSVQISSAGQALNNIASGISMLETAGNGLGQISGAIQNIRNLTVQAGSGALNEGDRQAIQSQIDQNIEAINMVAQTGNFNGQNLFDGSFSTTLQIGPNPGDSADVSIASNSASALGLQSIDVSNSASVAESLDRLDLALTQVNTQQAMMGGITNGLQSQANSLVDSSNSLAASHNTIYSTDYASVISEAAKNRIQLQASIYALKVHNESQKIGLALLENGPAQI